MGPELCVINSDLMIQQTTGWINSCTSLELIFKCIPCQTIYLEACWERWEASKKGFFALNFCLQDLICLVYIISNSFKLIWMMTLTVILVWRHGKSRGHFFVIIISLFILHSPCLSSFSCENGLVRQSYCTILTIWSRYESQLSCLKNINNFFTCNMKCWTNPFN